MCDIQHMIRLAPKDPRQDVWLHRSGHDQFRIIIVDLNRYSFMTEYTLEYLTSWSFRRFIALRSTPTSSRLCSSSISRTSSGDSQIAGRPGVLWMYGDSVAQNSAQSLLTCRRVTPILTAATDDSYLSWSASLRNVWPWQSEVCHLFPWSMQGKMILYGSLDLRWT